MEPWAGLEENKRVLVGRGCRFEDVEYGDSVGGLREGSYKRDGSNVHRCTEMMRPYWARGVFVVLRFGAKGDDFAVG